MKSKYFIPVYFLIVAPLLLSWGIIAHRSIGKIASNHLTSKAKFEVRNLLGSETLALVSTYADELRPYNKFDYTNKWHYLNAPEGLTYKEFVSFVEKDSVPNVYNALKKMVSILNDVKKSKEEKKFALKFVVHLVGDLHQPMHVSRAEDKGGNDIDVKFLNKKSNLHSVWDTGLVEYYGFTYTELANAIDNASATEIKKWQAAPITVWLYESYKISEQLYAETAKDATFNYDYFPEHQEIVKKRMLQAGVRLAGLLNKVYE